MSRIPRRGEAGFTLVELIVTITIEALVVGALGMAFIVILNGHKNSNESLSRSGDARIAANYIIGDARNSSGPELSLSDTTSCPDASPPVAGTPTPVVRFNWNSTSSSGASTPNIVNYVLVNNSLLRRVCVGGTLVSDRAVASSVSSTAVTCSPTANCTNSPTTINVTVTEVADSTGAVYQYSLKGAFRKLNATGPPVAVGPTQSVILLGSGGSCGAGTTGITLSGAAFMNVYGNAYVNTADGASCKAMSITNGTAFTAAKTYMLQGGTCYFTNPSVCPTINSYSPAIADPYATTLTAPSLTPPNGSACSGPQASQTASPGLFSGGFTLGGGNTCTLASGVYVVQNGFSISNGATLKTGAGGVLIYLVSGQFSVAGGAVVTLTSMGTTYSDVVLWQPATNTSTISWSNGGALVFNGVIYAPKAQLNITGNAQTPIVSGLVVQTVVLTNSGGVTVGYPLTITAPTSLPAGQVNQPYTNTSAWATGGGGTYTWSASGLPAGMTISATSGKISGTPTATYSGNVTITLNDAAGDAPDTQVLALSVVAAPSISTTSPITAGSLTAAYSKTLAATGGTSPFTWSAPSLPAGLSLSSGGVISGTPTAAGTFTIAATVTDNYGATDAKSLSITINGAPSITTATALPTGEKTVAYSTTLAGTGGTAPYTWALTSGTLPAGVTLAGGTGVISGTPTASGSFTPSFTLTDAAGATVPKSFTLTINPQPSISSVVLANAASGGTAGNIGQGDTITVTFSSAMKASSFCSTWTDGADGTLSADNQVTVSVSNASPDAVTVTSTGCTFNFGSIAMGSNSYVSAATTFKGAGASKSTIQWIQAQNKLVITLGVKFSGTTATVATSTPTYNASASIKDAQGAILSPASLVLAAGQKF